MAFPSAVTPRKRGSRGSDGAVALDPRFRGGDREWWWKTEESGVIVADASGGEAMRATPENAPGDLDDSGDDVARGGPVRFNTKIAVVLREDLAVWQKLNMTAFLVSGVAGTDADTIGESYEDASGHRYLPMFRQPVLIFA